MNPDAMFFGVLIVLPAVALVAWAWIAIAQVQSELHPIGGFAEGDFEIGPQATKHTEGARWAIRG